MINISFINIAVTVSSKRDYFIGFRVLLMWKLSNKGPVIGKSVQSFSKTYKQYTYTRAADGGEHNQKYKLTSSRDRRTRKASIGTGV